MAGKKDKNKDKNNQKDVSSLANGSTNVGVSSSSTSSGPGTSGAATSGASAANGLDIFAEPRLSVDVSVKLRDVIRPTAILDDPYEFNAKVEDGLCLPPKKLKTDKVSTLRHSLF